MMGSSGLPLGQRRRWDGGRRSSSDWTEAETEGAVEVGASGAIVGSGAAGVVVAAVAGGNVSLWGVVVAIAGVWLVLCHWRRSPRSIGRTAFPPLNHRMSKSIQANSRITR